MAGAAKKERPAERDYSHRLLIDKLGVKPGQRIAALEVESAEFLRDLDARVPEYSRGKRLADADLVFFSAEARGIWGGWNRWEGLFERMERFGWFIRRGRCTFAKLT